MAGRVALFGPTASPLLQHLSKANEPHLAAFTLEEYFTIPENGEFADKAT